MAEPGPRLDARELVAALESSRRLGILGSAPVADVVEHGSAFLDPLTTVSGTVVDLGSGGGAPGLVIAWMRRDLHVVLVDRRQGRTDHLRRLVGRLGMGGRVEVITTDAAELSQLLPSGADAVVARSFGPPARVLGAARGILKPGAPLVVAEPPSAAADRWTGPARAHGFVRAPWSDRRVAVLRMIHVEHR